MRSPFPGAAAVLALILTCLAIPARAQLLANGSFEAGPAIPLTTPIFAIPPGSTALTGWSVVVGAVNIVTDNYWVPLSGTRSLVLSNASGAGAIEQSIATAPGAIYRLTFWISGEPFSAPTLKRVRVNAGSAQQVFTFDNTPAWHWDMAWEQHTLDFAATGPSTALRFTSLEASAWGPALDSMKVELLTASVPTSASLALARVTPDPLRTTGRLEFSLPQAGHARIALYDVQGRSLATLADGDYAAGTHAVTLSAGTFGGRPGLYLAVLDSPQGRRVRRFTVLE
jgi:choice-of-anchor C domain-containing protein